MDILMVTSELSPYARTSRTADAVAALSKALCQLEHKVTVAVPRHPGFEAAGLLVARRLTPLELGGGEQVTVLDGQLSTGATLTLFDVPVDDAAMLCRAAAALVRQRAERGEPFDVVHLHDAASAPTAALLASQGLSAPTVLTVHDGASRGLVSSAELGRFGALPEVSATCREGARVSLLSLGAGSSDVVTGVSPAVALDMRNGERFASLTAVLADGAREVIGILSGLDYAVVNPATDSAIKSRFDAEDVGNKGSSKTDLLRTRGLDIEPSRPLIVAILEGGDGDDGAAMLALAAPSLLRNDASLIVLARGETPAHTTLATLSDDFGDRMEVETAYDEALARRACAGADIVLLPSPYEATGVLSRLAQRYGALPVGRAAGAHLDTLVDCDAALETGTGFLFDEATAEGMTGAMARALSAYGSSRWPSLRRRVMRLDLSWDRPARRYVQVYKQALAARGKAAGR